MAALAKTLYEPPEFDGFLTGQFQSVGSGYDYYLIFLISQGLQLGDIADSKQATSLLVCWTGTSAGTCRYMTRRQTSGTQRLYSVTAAPPVGLAKL
jgi:hypothetical protein